MTGKNKLEQSPNVEQEEKEPSVTRKDLSDSQRLVILENQYEEIKLAYSKLLGFVDGLNKFEKGGTADTKLYDESGGIYFVKEFGNNSNDAFNNLITTIYKANQAGFSSAPFALQVSADDKKKAGYEDLDEADKDNKKKKSEPKKLPNFIRVHSIEIKIDKNFHKYLKVYGGYKEADFMTNGICAFKNAIPKDFLIEMETLKVDVRGAPPKFMEVAWLSSDRKYIGGFRAMKENTTEEVENAEPNAEPKAQQSEADNTPARTVE